MPGIIEFLWLTVIFLAVSICLISLTKPKNFPPGPLICFPLLGHLPFLGIEPFRKVIDWKSYYGPIIGLQFASFRCVMISDYKLIKDAMNENAFAGRPKLPFMIDRSGGDAEGILFTQGQKWQELRRFTLRRLRDFGFGTRSMESIVHQEIQELIERFKGDIGKPISTCNRFNVAVVNALWAILTGERFKQDDPELNKVIKLITENFDQNNAVLMLCTFMPWITKYFPKLVGYKKNLEPMLTTVEFLKPYIEKHFETHLENHPRDFVDTFIDEIKVTKDPASSFHSTRSMNSLLFTLVDLFLAGAETTSTTLTWIFLYMARHQHVQEKLAEEIQNVVGNSRFPTLNDKTQMPYTEAVIHEVMRAATLLPLSVMHSTTEDVEFHGYNIPKDTMVLINLYEVHNNIEIWGDPEN